MGTIVGGLVDIDSFECPIGDERATNRPMSDAHRATTAAPIHDGGNNNTTDDKPDTTPGQTAPISGTDRAGYTQRLQREREKCTHCTH